MHQKAFGGRDPPGPAGELMRSPRPLNRNMGPTLRGGEERERGGEEGDGEGRRKGKMEKGRERRDTGGRMG